VEEEGDLKAGKYDIPEGLLYTKDHEWLRVASGALVEVGITHYASEMLHDIVFVTLPSVGSSLEAGKAASTVESVKSVSDVMAPVGGKVSAVNGELGQHPELINHDPYGKGWFFRLEATSLVAERKGLLTPSAYAKMVEQLAAQEG
jgi:glycine cleavage system H protein